MIAYVHAPNFDCTRSTWSITYSNGSSDGTDSFTFTDATEWIEFHQVDNLPDPVIEVKVIEVAKPKAPPPKVALALVPTSRYMAPARVPRRPRSKFKGIGTRNWQNRKARCG